MLHIFVDPAQMKGDLLYVTGKDVNHIKNVMRLKQGDEISVRTGQDDREYRYGIEEFTDSEVVCRLRFVKEADVELPVKVYIFQGLPKADKMDVSSSWTEPKRARRPRDGRPSRSRRPSRAAELWFRWCANP